jgi:cysteine synthase
MSSGASLFAAIEKSKTIEFGNIVVIIPDRGEKYLSTSLFCTRNEAAFLC